MNIDVLRQVWANNVDIRIDSQTLCVDGACYPIEGGVIRCRKDDGYNAAFALQWKKFRQTQLDDANSTTLTRDRFLRETGWTEEDLKGKLVLEAGCGAGRFTRLLAQSGAQVVTFDFSSAVDASAENNRTYPNVTFLQCDIFDMPFKNGAFDFVFCHGVLQHTPDPERAFRALERKVRPSGRISVDVYLKDGKIRPWKSKYLWRPISTRVKPVKLMAFLEWFIPLWLPIDTFIKRIPVLGNYLGAVVPCWNYFYTELSAEEKVHWAIMDTFDALAPRYDLPVTVPEIEGWFESGDYQSYKVHLGGNGVVGNGIRIS